MVVPGALAAAEPGAPVSNAVAPEAAAAAAAVPADEMEESNVLFMLASLCIRPPPLLLPERPLRMFSSDGCR